MLSKLGARGAKAPAWLDPAHAMCALEAAKLSIMMKQSAVNSNSHALSINMFQGSNFPLILSAACAALTLLAPPAARADEDGKTPRRTLVSWLFPGSDPAINRRQKNEMITSVTQNVTSASKPKVSRKFSRAKTVNRSAIKSFVAVRSEQPLLQPVGPTANSSAPEALPPVIPDQNDDPDLKAAKLAEIRSIQQLDAIQRRRLILFLDDGDRRIRLEAARRIAELEEKGLSEGDPFLR